MKDLLQKLIELKDAINQADRRDDIYLIVSLERYEKHINTLFDDLQKRDVKKKSVYC